MAKTSLFNSYLLSGLLLCLPAAHATENMSLDLIELLGSFDEEDQAALDTAMDSMDTFKENESRAVDESDQNVGDGRNVGEENEMQ